MELWRYAEEGSQGWGHPLERRQVGITRDDPLRAQLEHFCRVVRGEEEPMVGAEDGARSLAVALAAREPAEKGTAVAPGALWTMETQRPEGNEP